MADRTKQQVSAPNSFRPPALSAPKPSLPYMTPGHSPWPFERGALERNTRTVAADAGYLRARADQAAAMTELIGKRDDLAMAIARLHSLPERCAHEYEKGRLSRLNELRCLRLQHELDETTAKISLAAARLQLAQYEPQPAPPPEPPAPIPAPAPTGLTPADVEKVAQAMPEMKPETIRSLLWALGGLMAEKAK